MYIGSLVSDISLNFSKSVKIIDFGLQLNFSTVMGANKISIKKSILVQKF